MTEQRVGGLTGRIEALSPQQLQALAERLLAMRPKAGDEDRQTLRPTRVPLSFSQEGLWLLERLGFGGSTYNECLALRLTGTLSRDALVWSVGEIVRRHEALRTRFVVVGDQPCQVVEPPGEFHVLEADVSMHGPQERESELREHLAARVSEPFDLEKGPLCRASLIRISEREHILSWVVHHLVWDGLSMWLFLGELIAHYTARVDGRPANLPPIRFHYADYTLRQRRRVPMGIAELVTYWRKQLEGAAPTLDLPTDRPRQSLANLQGGARHMVYLDAEFVGELSRVARQEDVTLHMLALAAFKVVLFRWSGINDVVVGTPVAGRTGRETESLIGYFSNMLVMRTNVSGDSTFRELLHGVKATATGAFAHQDMPFGTLVGELSPPRSLGRNPLFQVSFALHDFHGEVSPEVTSELQIAPMDLAEWTPKFELELHLAKGSNGMTAWFSYQTALFDPDTVERWMGHYRSVLGAIARDPGIWVSRIPMLAEGERTRLLEEFHTVAASEPVGELVHEIFEERVRRNPAGTALVCGPSEWTFAELNAQANRLAHLLSERNVGPDRRVAILSRDVADFVVGLLAVLKAGGTCMPLGPDDSPVPLSDVLERAPPHVLLVSGYPVPSVPSSDIDVISLDREKRTLGKKSDANPGWRGIAGHHLAYVMSPVISSGERKQVMIEHRGVTALVQWMSTHFPSERFAQTAFSVRSDLEGSLIDLLAWLTSGATIHALVSPLHANERIPEVPLLCAAPSALERLVDEGRLGRKLQALVIRGGRPSRRLVDKVFSTTSVKRITCLFGYPETTSYSTDLHIDAPADVQRKIGRPMPNTRVYILDAERELAPIGVFGELWIGGVAVGRGYLNDPEATQERFAADPFDTRSAGRIFRTGRNARWLDDGSIELEDALEKPTPTNSRIRELRKELGRCEDIREADVVAHGEGEQRLIAYVVPHSDRAAKRRETARLRWEAEHVALWRERSRDIYGSRVEPTEPGFDVTGWISSFTKLPFNPVELREAVDETIRRVKRLKPRRVLEVGCGTGLVLHGVAPGCERYAATDLSADALQRLQSQLAQSRAGCAFELYELPAHEIGALSLRPCDTVILDSVVQCFPSAEYALEVLSHAVDRVMPAGNIFVGGVRHLSLLRAFHSAAQLSQTADSMSVAEFRWRVRERMVAERDLALSPKFFVELGRRNDRIGDVQIHLRRGCHDNELTQFHYDVILRVSDKTPRVRPILLDGREPAVAQSIAGLIRTRRPKRVVVRSIPNARLARPLALQRLLDTPSPEVQYVGELRQLVETDDTGRGLDPELLWNMGERLEYDVHLDWSTAREDGSFDAVFSRPDAV